MKPENEECAPYVGPRPFERWHSDRFCARTREINEAFSLIVAHPVLLIYAQSGAGKTSLVNAGLRPLLEQEKLDVLPVARVYGKIPEKYPLEEIANPYILNTLISWARDDEGDIGRLNRSSLSRFLGARCPLLCVDDIRDPTQLAGRLLRDSDHLTQHLREQLSDTTQRLLSQHTGLACPSDRLQQSLVHDLNRVLKGPCLYTEERFAAKSLPAKTLAQTENRLRGPDLLCLNRRLLEQAFPDEIQSLASQEREGRAADDEELPSQRVAIIDQFEELFTSYPGRWRDREPFFWQVSDALECDPRLRVVFVMREEQIAQLDPYLPILPERLRTRLRIERLGKDTALQAVKEPLDKLQTGRSFDDGVAEGLVNQLLKEKVLVPASQAVNAEGQYAEPEKPRSDRPGLWAKLLAQLGMEAGGSSETVVEIEGPYVEPVQLQVVCSRIWDSLKPHEKIITQDHIEEFGNVTEALLEFYERGIRQTARRNGVHEDKPDIWWRKGIQWPVRLIEYLRSTVRERKLRAWFEGELITTWGTRSTVVQGPTKTGRLRNDTVETLDGLHLVRWEKRAGGRWYELTHDRFIDAIQESNQRWGGKWAKRLVAVAALTVLAMVLIALPITSWIAQAQENQVRSGALVEKARYITDDQLDLALLLSLEAIRSNDTFPARSSLLEAIQHKPFLSTFLRGHEDRITGVTFSADGQELASIDSAGTIVLWDVATGREHRRLRTPPASPELRAAFSSDGQRLATTDDGGITTLWDLETGEGQGSFKSPAGLAGASPAFSPDGQKLATSSDNTIILRDVSTKDPGGFAALRGHKKRVTSISFSPDGRLASGSCGEFDSEPSKCTQGEIWLWDVAENKVITATLRGHTDEVTAVTFSPDGRMLASGGTDGATILWDVVSHQPLSNLLTGTDTPPAVSSVAFSPDGQRLAAGRTDGTLTLWDLATGEQIANLSGHAGTVNGVTFSPDGGLLASDGDDRTIVLWDLDRRSQFGVSLPGSQSAVGSLDFRPEGEMLAWGSDDGNVVVWDVAAGREINTLVHPAASPMLSVAFRPDSPQGILSRIAARLGLGHIGDRTLASGDANGSIILWDVLSGKPLGDPLVGSETGSPVWSIAFSPDGRWLASGGCGSFDPAEGLCVEGEIRLWDVDRRDFTTLPGHKSEVLSLAFSPDGRLLASGGCGEFDPTARRCTVGEIRLWDTVAGEILHSHLGHGMEVRSVAFSPDGRVLATGSCAEVPPSSFSCTQGETRLWDVAKGQAMDTLPGYANEVLSVAFSPDGKTLATTENDGTITLWDVPTREVLTHLVSGAGVEAPVWSAAFSPDTSQGILARTATRLGLRSRVEGPEGADKQILATGDNRGRVTLWDVSYESWQALACRMANRNMDEEEWSTNMGPDVDYQCTCDELPSGKANGSEATCEP